jgi:6-phosphogluconate dehydrogenase
LRISSGATPAHRRDTFYQLFFYLKSALTVCSSKGQAFQLTDGLDFLSIQAYRPWMEDRSREKVTTYKADLRMFVAETRQRGATPVLVTSVNRRPSRKFQNSCQPDAFRGETAGKLTHNKQGFQPLVRPGRNIHSTGVFMQKESCDFGLIGLAVMGQNLVLNMNDHGYRVAVFNRTVSKVDEFIQNEAAGTQVVGAHSIEEFVGSLKRPRRVMLMVKAGDTVDHMIDGLLPHLDKGDIVIDGGNSHYPDTNRRTSDLAEKGILFIGTGVSGGEEGARFGPSIMPGGNSAAWPHVKEIFQSIAAKVEDGSPCCDWVGENGAGHYVKMIHNGIEYGDMQLICEAYHLLSAGLGLSAEDLHEVFTEWNKGELDSYLIEITSEIFTKKDEDGAPMVDKILDAAGQKGTGKWTGVNSLELGVPVTLIGEAVYARCLSAMKDERVVASEILTGPKLPAAQDRQQFIEDVRRALYCSKVVSYAQGYMLMREAAKEQGWDLNYGGIALMWRGGCIIRSRFLGKIKEAFDKNPQLTNLLLDDFFSRLLNEYQASWRRAVIRAIEYGVPTPAFSTALSFFDGYRAERLPANLLQAQRDFFGAHTYERVDRPRGEFFHTNWTGRGGRVSSGTYNV